jgi:hypothetical protein
MTSKVHVTQGVGTRFFSCDARLTAAMLQQQRTQEEERKATEGYLHHTLIPERNYFLVHHKWWGLWRSFISTTGGSAERPGPIDNSDLLCAPADDPLPAERAVLKAGLRQDVDFHVVCEQLWQLLLRWYGLSEPPVVVMRKCIMLGVLRKPHLELFPVNVHVLNAELASRPVSVNYSSVDPCRVFTFARCQSIKDIRRFIGPWINSAPHNLDIVIERGTMGKPEPPGPDVLTHTLVQDEDGKTLEELGVVDGDTFRITRYTTRLQ